MEHANNELTDKQIENWRRVLVTMIGPYALIIPREQIQHIRDRMKSDIDNLPEESKEEYCICDQNHIGYTRHMDDTITCNRCRLIRKE